MTNPAARNQESPASSSWATTACQFDGFVRRGEQLVADLRRAARADKEKDVLVTVHNPLATDLEVDAARQLVVECTKAIFSEGNTIPGVDLHFVDTRKNEMPVLRVLIAKDIPRGWAMPLVPRSNMDREPPKHWHFGANKDWSAHIPNELRPVVDRIVVPNVNRGLSAAV